jgi:hypothetical protein
MRGRIVLLALATTLFVGTFAPAAQAAGQRKPDLHPEGVLYIADCDAETLFIEVEVANLGRGTAGTFGVTLWFNEVRQPVRVVDGLGAGESEKVAWTVPYDGGFEFDREHVDARDRVRETVETNNGTSDKDEFCFGADPGLPGFPWSDRPPR